MFTTGMCEGESENLFPVPKFGCWSTKHCILITQILIGLTLLNCVRLFEHSLEISLFSDSLPTAVKSRILTCFGAFKPFLESDAYKLFQNLLTWCSVLGTFHLILEHKLLSALSNGKMNQAYGNSEAIWHFKNKYPLWSDTWVFDMCFGPQELSPFKRYFPLLRQHARTLFCISGYLSVLGNPGVPMMFTSGTTKRK